MRACGCTVVLVMLRSTAVLRPITGARNAGAGAEAQAREN